MQANLEQPDDDDLEQQVAAGDVVALGKFFELHRARLRRILALRMHERVKARVDPSDVIQESFLEASRRLGQYAEEENRMPPFLWLRFLTVQKLLQVHRKHLGKQRDAARDVSIYQQGTPEATSDVLVQELIARRTSPSQAAQRAEMKTRLGEALDSMNEIDREVLVLRHFEHLSGVEAARVLDIAVSAASKRYVRALERLADQLDGLEGSDGLLARKG